MTRKNPVAAEVAAAATSQSELSSVLLDVLRNLNREAQAATALDEKANAAIVRYRAIASDLFVLPENSINTGSSLSGAPRVC